MRVKVIGDTHEVIYKKAVGKKKDVTIKTSKTIKLVFTEKLPDKASEKLPDKASEKLADKASDKATEASNKAYRHRVEEFCSELEETFANSRLKKIAKKAVKITHFKKGQIEVDLDFSKFTHYEDVLALKKIVYDLFNKYFTSSVKKNVDDLWTKHEDCLELLALACRHDRDAEFLLDTDEVIEKKSNGPKKVDKITKAKNPKGQPAAASSKTHDQTTERVSEMHSSPSVPITRKNNMFNFFSERETSATSESGSMTLLTASSSPVNEGASVRFETARPFEPSLELGTESERSEDDLKNFLMFGEEEQDEFPLESAAESEGDEDDRTQSDTESVFSTGSNSSRGSNASSIASLKSYLSYMSQGRRNSVPLKPDSLGVGSPEAPSKLKKG